MENKKYAYVATLTSNDEYMMATIVLWYSWKKTNSKYPFYILVSNAVLDKNIKFLNDLGIPTIQMPMIYFPINILDINFRKVPQLFYGWCHAFFSISIYRLTQFDKVLQLGSDMIMLQNIDDFFDHPDRTGVENRFAADLGRDYYITPEDHASMYPCGEPKLAVPSEAEWKRMWDIINNLKPQTPISDEMMIRLWCPDWPNRPELHMPRCYNYAAFQGDRTNDKFNDVTIPEIKLLHFIQFKPWKYQRGVEFTGKYKQSQLFRMWWDYFDEAMYSLNESQRKYLLEEGVFRLGRAQMLSFMEHTSDDILKQYPDRFEQM